MSSNNKHSYHFIVGEVNGEGHFSINKVLDHHNEPHFCLQAESEDAVVEKSIRAINFFVEYQQKVKSTNNSNYIKVTKTLPYRSQFYNFVPKEIVFAAAS